MTLNRISWRPALWHIPVHPLPGMEIVRKHINMVETCRAQGIRTTAKIVQCFGVVVQQFVWESDQTLWVSVYFEWWNSDTKHILSTTPEVGPVLQLHSSKPPEVQAGSGVHILTFLSIDIYPLVMTNSLLWKSTIYSGFFHST